MRGGTDIGRVRGLGAARQGTHHWWMMRVTSVAVLLLGVWFLAALLRLPDYGYETVTAWLAQPIVAVPMLLFVVSVFYHLHLGLVELIEDYVHGGARIAAHLALTAFAIAGGLLAVFSILKIALGA